MSLSSFQHLAGNLEQWLVVCENCIVSHSAVKRYYKDDVNEMVVLPLFGESDTVEVHPDKNAVHFITSGTTQKHIPDQLLKVLQCGVTILLNDFLY